MARTGHTPQSKDDLAKVEVIGEVEPGFNDGIGVNLRAIAYFSVTWKMWDKMILSSVFTSHKALSSALIFPDLGLNCSLEVQLKKEKGKGKKEKLKIGEAFDSLKCHLD